ERVIASLSTWLNKLSDEGAVLRPDLDQVPALAVEREAHWRRIVTADFLSSDEKRKLLGLPAQEGADD
ncbi:MAG: phage portal protein, partial [Planktomarina sp.]